MQIDSNDYDSMNDNYLALSMLFIMTLFQNFSWILDPLDPYYLTYAYSLS